MKVLLKDVADKAGCSISAASAMLNCSASQSRYSKDLEVRVRQIAREMGYTISTQRRNKLSISEGRNDIALVYSEFARDASTDFLRGFSQHFELQADRYGFNANRLYPGDPQGNFIVDAAIKSKKVAAYVLFIFEEDEYRRLPQLNAPLIHINPCAPKENNCIMPDDWSISEKAFDFIMSCGYRRICYISKAETSHYSKSVRLDNMCRLSQDNNIGFDVYDSIKELDAQKIENYVNARDCCFVCYNGPIAEEFYGLLEFMGLQDELLTHYGIFSMAGAGTKKSRFISHIEIDIDQMGRMAVEAVVDMRRHKSTTFQNRLLPETVIPGRSCILPRSI